MALLRAGRVKTALAGGVDSLSRLTCFGFHSLQLVDADGCKPLDAYRRGINVGEGAGFLLLTTEKCENVLARVTGAGLSCDAYHASAPHPDGEGAQAAIMAALADAGIGPEDVDYINLHGTGTPDNDAAEAKAIRAVFATPPPLSSIKGATGHSLAASGGIEAVVSALAGCKGFIPATTGCRQVDDRLGIEPVLSPRFTKARRVLSNSFGFGGNNTALVIDQVNDHFNDERGRKNWRDDNNIAGEFLAVHGFSCLTGAGGLKTVMARLAAGESVSGQLPETALCAAIPHRATRRLGRLAKLALTLAVDAVSRTEPDLPKIKSVFFASGWGALSETYNFLHGLAESEGQFPSPTDFVGSTHNSAAGRIAIHFQAKGKNLAFSGGDYSFEQALMAAHTMLDATENSLFVAADEGHSRFSPLFDPSIDADETLADGGGGFWLNRQITEAKCLIRLDFYGNGRDGLPTALLTALGGPARVAVDYAAIFVGAPQAKRLLADRQLAEFLGQVGEIPVWRHRGAVGEFASAQAVAVAVAAACVEAAQIPAALTGGNIALRTDQKILVLGLGDTVTAMSLAAPNTRGDQLLP
ncbi:MAG: beta-ketoacyl synthase chain length factor, partial [Desulfobulbaceae bacterium]|jgi:3-oxoacyl-(acyl-carrier-protein) synthase|nr:beta-ketoacyl synthase chain length factor [Desulfobulbaceae bacterium]